MSTVVCHLIRADRGARVRAVRLVTLHESAVWTAPAREGGADGAAAALEDAREAAGWIASTLPGLAGARGRRIDRVCLDTDGAVCAWIAAPTSDPALARAEAQRQMDAARGSADDGVDGIEGYEAPPRFPDLPGELTMQPLMTTTAAGGEPAAGGRVAVLASPDATARLLLDELDRAGVEFGAVLSVWHAMASVWDPGARGVRAEASGGAIEAESAPPLAAIALPDPASQRLLWCWSRGGALVATGSIRLVRGAGERVMLTPGCVGRLTAEWLSWSAQLGVAPARVVCVGPFGAGGEDRVRFEPGAFAGAIAAAWPRSTVDVVSLDEPVEQTLTRLVDRVDAGRDAAATGAPRAVSEMETLTDRPGRAHRRMYASAAVALVLLAVVAAAAGWQLGREAKAATARRAAILEAQAELLKEIDPQIGRRNPLADLRRKLDELGPTAAGPAFDPPRPILAELESLALAIQNPAYTLESIQLGEFAVSMTVSADSTTAYEDLEASLQSIARHTRHQQPSIEERNGRVRLSYTFTWK